MVKRVGLGIFGTQKFSPLNKLYFVKAASQVAKKKRIYPFPLLGKGAILFQARTAGLQYSLLLCSVRNFEIRRLKKSAVVVLFSDKKTFSRLYITYKVGELILFCWWNAETIFENSCHCSYKKGRECSQL